MLELDVLMHAFYSTYFATMSDTEQQAFADILLKEDPEIMKLVFSSKPQEGVLETLRQFQLSCGIDSKS